MKFSLDAQFIPLSLRRNPSFAVLLARLDHDTQGLSCLLPQSWYDNPASVSSLDGILLVARQFPAFCTAWRVSELPKECLAKCSCSVALGVLRQVRVVDHPDSILDVEHQARHLSKRQRGAPRRALDRVQIIQRCLFMHHLHCPIDLITRPPPLRATICSSVWKRFPSHVPTCHLSVMTAPETFSATLNITAATEWQEHPSMLSSLQPLTRRCAITRHMALALVQSFR